MIYAVSCVLDGNGAAFFSAGYHRDRFTAVATEGEEKSVKLLVVRVDLFDDVFLAFDSFPERHLFHRNSFRKFVN